MTAAASAGTRDDHMILCEEETVFEKTKEARKGSKEQKVQANVMVQHGESKDVMVADIEENEEQEYQRKKEHLLTRVESEQVADEKRIADLEERNQVLEQQLKQMKLVGRPAGVVKEEKEQLGKEIQSLAALQERRHEYLRRLKKR